MYKGVQSNRFHCTCLINEILLYKHAVTLALILIIKGPLTSTKYFLKRSQQNAPKGQFWPAGHAVDSTLSRESPELKISPRMSSTWVWI